VPQKGRPDRKVYQTTAEGREELLEWLAGAEPKVLGKSAFLLQIFFMGLLSDDQAVALLEARAACLRESLASLESLRTEGNEPAAPSPAPRLDFFSWLPLDYGLHLLDLTANWIDDIVKTIRRNEHTRGKAAALTFPVSKNKPAP
jgi:hypothetical protein